MTPRARPGDASSVFAVLLAGGKGTRFWPASRVSHPKQFLHLMGDRSLLRLTCDRFERLVGRERILVITGAAYADRVREEVPDLPEENLLIEPSGRDTAPAAVLASRHARAREEDPVLAIAPTDHVIRDEAAFGRAFQTAVDEARAGSLVTLGVVPDRPATTYGYIEVARAVSSHAPEHAAAVVRFREKPSDIEAAEFVASGRFYWNAGMFFWRTTAFESALAQANPAFAAAAAALPPPPPAAGPGSEGFVAAWNRVPAISIDYALMENAPEIRVVPLDAGWSDVGGWDAASELLPADDAGNRLAPEVLYLRSRNCAVHRHGGGDRRFFAVVEADGIVIVETPDAVLVTRRGAGEAVRDVVRRLRETGRDRLI